MLVVKNTSFICLSLTSLLWICWICSKKFKLNNDLSYYETIFFPVQSQLKINQKRMKKHHGLSKLQKFSIWVMQLLTKPLKNTHQFLSCFTHHVWIIFFSLQIFSADTNNSFDPFWLYLKSLDVRGSNSTILYSQNLLKILFFIQLCLDFDWSFEYKTILKGIKA